MTQTDWILFEAGTGSTGNSALATFLNFRSLKEKERQSCFKKKKEPLKDSSVKVTSVQLVVHSVIYLLCVNEPTSMFLCRFQLVLCA